MQFKRYLDAYISLFASDAALYADRTRPLTLFMIPQDEALAIIQRVESIVRKETNLINLMPPVTIVGDLHGQFIDLIRIFQKNGLPSSVSSKKFLFLGDFVDRGEFSFDVLIFLFILKISYPENIFFIRGNHEFNSLSSSCGFLNEIVDKYSEPSVFNAFLNVFNVMPLAALIGEKILAIHGGLGPNFNSIAQIQKINRPLCEFGQNEVADEILWSDPSNEIETYEPSIRGAGYFFGRTVAEQFCQSNNIDVIIRGHECVMNGFEEFFDGKVITIFSASNSTGTVGNDAAVMEVKSDMSRIIKQYPPLPYLLRSDVFYSAHLRLIPPQPPGKVSSGGSPRKLTRNPHANSSKDASSSIRSLWSCDNVASSAKNLPMWRPQHQLPSLGPVQFINSSGSQATTINTANSNNIPIGNNFNSNNNNNNNNGDKNMRNHLAGGKITPSCSSQNYGNYSSQNSTGFKDDSKCCGIGAGGLRKACIPTIISENNAPHLPVVLPREGLISLHPHQPLAPVKRPNSTRRKRKVNLC